MTDSEKQKVYILFINHKTMNDILGVFSTSDKALDAFNKFCNQMNGAIDRSKIVIMETELL